MSRQIPEESRKQSQRYQRDESLDILRGLTTFAMILVNTADSRTRPGWLAHASGLHQSITFADTIFPCFLFTAGLTEEATGGPPGIKKGLRRAAILSLYGVAYNNVELRKAVYGISRHIVYHQVLGRLGIATAIGATGLPPSLLAALWHLLTSIRPFDPPGQSTQALLDCLVFGRNHLYDSVDGFDPEGLLGSLLMAPVSLILGRQAYAIAHHYIQPRLSFSILPNLGLFISLTGLLPQIRVPISKNHWTPTFVGLTTATSLVYWGTASILSRFRASQFVAKIGRCSLEVYLISSFLHGALSELGIWEKLANLMINSLGISDQLAYIANSSILGIGMIPLSGLLFKKGWMIRV
ncbi:uncharacterized protein MELLADRAFT_77684 [Melampsora larici-populina 98AG31]|uniref:Uncharacterized protein n=1 Tax=Melampsora larici-populina (strain 98AG31 / pathotype 3-4-7) TaxID=747676 RepID=F4RKI4_MELLP|nr:uncharacterized protein MELLADRAFT_77684 [Melampsora larici-populina 98AG31]EGG07100.1 hypothetical protein MELLADRAFT_77684 [Melampsora larici-populina 98AG31]